MYNKKVFNKLVRDNIPEIILKKGGESEIRILEDAEYSDLLNKKLMEECNEVIEADDTESKKEELADDFADKYEGKIEEFIAFISQKEVAVPGSFRQTWRFIEKDKHSLERFSNMHLIFK